MIRLIQWLIFGHVHEWETMKSVPLVDGRLRIGDAVYLRCKKCGVWKRQELC